MGTITWIYRCKKCKKKESTVFEDSSSKKNTKMDLTGNKDYICRACREKNNGNQN